MAIIFSARCALPGVNVTFFGLLLLRMHTKQPWWEWYNGLKLFLKEYSLISMYLCFLLQISVFFSAVSCKKYIILESMTNKYSALLILLGLYYLSPNGFPSPYLLSCQSGYRLGKLWSSSKIGQTADSKFNSITKEHF